MIAKVITDQGVTIFKAESVKNEDGFLKFKNVRIDDSESIEETWIQSNTCKGIIWKDKPVDVITEKKENNKN